MSKFWRNKRDNLLAVAKAKIAEISALQKEHEHLCRQAAGAKDATEEIYRKLEPVEREYCKKLWRGDSKLVLVGTAPADSAGVSEKACRTPLLKSNLTKPTRTNRVISTLQNDGKLLRCYTQNFDMLEHKAALSVGIGEQDETCVNLHGFLCNLRCTLCGTTVD
ncbi:hypothetical protein C2857_003333 [Epichloe festucae Fl1]|uniref:Uncharacterized protein n=1 Tax=Epichloe festucae (strain Fl1) TaxID=877507 RepID=A0A7U3Q0J4_EPIFF|nr:hypothetical protein C2857_003333 [Epichloe festucae Fl1]